MTKIADDPTSWGAPFDPNLSRWANNIAADITNPLICFFHGTVVVTGPQLTCEQISALQCAVARAMQANLDAPVNTNELQFIWRDSD